MCFSALSLLLGILLVDVAFCEAEAKVDNATVISRREILEQQARTAYQNACYRLQEISNWMTAVFRIKSVWASATVNEISSRSDGSLTDSDRRNKAGLPSRFKAGGSECSLSSVQVTAQTYAYLQSQLVMMKWLMGRNIFKSSKEKLGEAKERMKMLETFNSTLNDVVSKLKQNTVNTSTPLDLEAWKARNIIKDAQEGRFLQLFQRPKTLLMNILDDQVMNNRIRDQTEPSNFFQNLGRNLDRLIFPLAPVKLNANLNNSVTDAEHFRAKMKQSVAEDEHSGSEETPATTKHSVPKFEQSDKPGHFTAELKTDNAVMFSSIL